MKASSRRFVWAIPTPRLTCILVVIAAAWSPPPVTAVESDIELRIGGIGGVYFLAEPGELTIDIEKRDRNRSRRRTDMQVVLVGPDRQVLQKAMIPDDGKPSGSGVGPAGRARLVTRVDRKGVYGLNVTVSQDRYGTEIIWGFRTNCPHYLIETARGHRDARRQEPIVLLNPDRPGNVCFMPRKGAFGMEITDIPQGVKSLSVYDAQDTLVHTLPVGPDGQARHTFPADVHRESVPWRLHFMKHHATIQIDGVTRWEDGDLFPNLPYWTPNGSSYFPFQAYRWLLTPYSRTVYGKPGEEENFAETNLQLHNNLDHETAIQLKIEYPDEPWPVRVPTQPFVLGAKESRKVSIQYGELPEGQRRVCHVRATPIENPEFSTYSTLTFQAGVAPISKPLDLPLVLKPYEHENEQFGYLPDYPVENQPYFDLRNRPFVRTEAGIATMRGEEWSVSELRTAVASGDSALVGSSFAMPSTKVAFDRDNDLYLVATSGRKAALLHSVDGGKMFSAYVIPGQENRSRSYDIEQFSGHNIPDGPPPVLRYTLMAQTPGMIWRRVNDLELFLLEKNEGQLSIGEPILISKRCIGLSAHSGIPATVVSRGTKVHVAWAEATDPKSNVPGGPTYVATYNRQKKSLGKPVLVAYGSPPNDIHNTPSITMDSQGYLHVLAGTHGQPFQYARSLEPNDAHSGWTEAEAVGDGLRQTYVGLVCGPDDTLHLVFRLWRRGTDRFPASDCATLAYQRKPPGGDWEPPRVLIEPPFSEYSIFYHRLTIDRIGRLLLSYDYWSTHWFYRTDHWGQRRALMVSSDGGLTWKLPQSMDSW